MLGIEVVSIGDELVEGRLIDTNVVFISERLFEKGLKMSRHTSVGDDPGAIAQVLQEAASRSAVVVVSGGLGPTTDDLTAESAAQAFDRPVVLYERALEHVRDLFTRMGRPMPSTNVRQAYLPEGATLLENRRGTATGFYIDEGPCRLYFLPGVPVELHPMFDRLVLPDMLARVPPSPVLVRTLKTFGLGESRIGGWIEDIGAALPGRLTIQYRAAMPEVHLRLCLSGFPPGDPAADAELDRIEQVVRDRLGAAVFETGSRSLPEVVLAWLRARGQTVATAESCTGGLLSSVLTDVPGASQSFLGGVVAYANEVKVDMLHVDAHDIARFGAVSDSVAVAMAQGARARFGSTWSVAVTGIAGPSGGTPEKPVGTVFIAVDGEGGPVVVPQRFPGDRQRVRRFAAWAALDLLRRKMLNISLEPV